MTGEQDSGSGSGGTPPPQGPPQYGPPSYGTGPYGASPYGASPYGGAPGFGTPGYAAPGVGAPGMLASSADRDRAMDMLNAAYGEGRLTKDEFDIRCSRVLAARHYGDLAPIVADLPGGAFTAPVPYQQDYYPATVRPPLCLRDDLLGYWLFLSCSTYSAQSAHPVSLPRTRPWALSSQANATTPPQAPSLSSGPTSA